MARAIEHFDVEVYAFVFLSNHFHMIVKAAPGQLSPFMGYIQSNIARKTGPQIDWRGKFWQRRFSAEPILDEAALENRLSYIFSHGAKEGLVEKPEQWPGLTSFPELVHGIRRTFLWYDATAHYLAKKRGESGSIETFQTPYTLTLTPLPHWSGRHQQRAKELLATAEIYAQELMVGKNILGAQKILEQHPHAKPKCSKRSPRPFCHASTAQARKSFRKLYKNFVNDYKEAAHALIGGDAYAKFPDFSYRPPLSFQWQPNPSN